MGCGISSEYVNSSSKIAVSRDSVSLTHVTDDIEIERSKQRFGGARDSVAIMKNGEPMSINNNASSKFSKARDSVQVYKQQRQPASSSSSSSSSSSIVGAVTNFNKQPPSFEEEYISFKALQKGQELLCRDIFTSKYTQKQMSRWREAEIVRTKGNMITVHFVGWADKHDIKLDMSEGNDISRIAPMSILDVFSEEDVKVGKPMTKYQAEKALSFLQTGKAQNFNEDEEINSISNHTGIERRLSLKNVMPIDYFHKLGFFSSSKSSRSSFQQKQKQQQQSTGEDQVSTSGQSSPYSYTTPFGVGTRSIAMSPLSITSNNHDINNDDNNNQGEVTSPALSPSSRSHSKSARIKKFHRRQSFPGSKYATVALSTFEERMASIGLHVIEVEGDGNCLYRAVAHQFFLDESRHEEIRAEVTKHLQKHEDRFKPFIDGDYDDYVNEQMESGTWGDDIEIKVIEEIYDRRVVIYDSEEVDSHGVLQPMNTNFDEEGDASTVQPIILSYHGQMHYNSVFNERYSLPIKDRRKGKSKSGIMLKRAKSMTDNNISTIREQQVHKTGSNVTVP